MTMKMSRSGAYKQIGNAMLTMAGNRFFSSATTRAVANDSVISTVRKGTLNPLMGSSVNSIWAKTASVYWAQRGISVRNQSTLAMNEKDIDQGKQPEASAGGQSNKDGKGAINYWGVASNKITREDGTELKWACFRPWETCKADMSIDLKNHHAPNTLVDKFAYWTVKSLRWPTDLFFQRRYGCRSMMLETVAAVPGMGYLKEEANHSYTQFSELDKGNIKNVPASANAIDDRQFSHESTFRPLSPHILIYKPQSNSTLSILNRISGALLATTALGFHLIYLKIGLICFTYWNFYQFLFYSSKLIPIYLSINALALAFHVFKGLRLLWGHL